MEYHLILDDSGQLHPNYPHNNIFVYGGIFINEKYYHRMYKRHKNLVSKIKKQKNIKSELKSIYMENKTKRRLLKGLLADKSLYHQVFIRVYVDKLNRIDFFSPKETIRYKNFLIKKLIQRLLYLRILPLNATALNISIDEQNVAFSGKNSLEDYLMGFLNDENYSNAGKKLGANDYRIDINVNYKNSEHDFLIQAADLLANSYLHISNGSEHLESLLKPNKIIIIEP